MIDEEAFELELVECGIAVSGRNPDEPIGMCPLLGDPGMDGGGMNFCLLARRRIKRRLRA